MSMPYVNFETIRHRDTNKLYVSADDVANFLRLQALVEDEPKKKLLEELAKVFEKMFSTCK